MDNSRRRSQVDSIVLLGFAFLVSSAAGKFHGHPHDGRLRRALVDTSLSSSTRKIFDITKFGAVPDDDNEDNVQAFMKTWVAACRTSTSPAKILIPEGSFLVGQVVWQGPCKSKEPIIVEVQGTVKATTDLSEYSSPEWFDIEDVDGLVITGNGTFDGQGPKVWQYNDCKTNADCQKLPASLKFSRVSNAIVEGITSLNSKWFHLFTYSCKNFTFHNVKVIAPDDSPNTDGIHLSATTGVNITSATIGTGDDCIAIVQDCHDISVSDVTCGPGHGISVGSLGKWPDDKGSTGILVKNCTLTGSTNGARIKTWAGPTSGEASDIVYEDLIMEDVKNPIIIDQNYGKYKNQPSKWKLSDIHFRNIRGTSVSKVSVSIGCSSAFPCQGVELADIDLTYSGTKFKSSKTDSICANAKVTHSGTQNPVPCSGSGSVVSDQ